MKPSTSKQRAMVGAYRDAAAAPTYLDTEVATFGADDGLAQELRAAVAVGPADANDNADEAGSGPLTAEMQAMAEECLPLVKYIALRIANRVPKSVELDDLIGEGIMGLLSSVRHFDPARGAKFKTFAEPRIRGAILDSLRNLDWVPRSLRQKQKDIEDAYHVLSMRHGRAAEDEEVALHLGVPLEDLHKSLDDLKGVTLGSIEDNSGEGEGLLAFIADPDAEDPHQTLHGKEMKDLLAKMVGELPEKEKQVMDFYYKEEMNMKEIGLAMKITESRVSQLHTKAILRLRAKLRRARAA